MRTYTINLQQQRNWAAFYLLVIFMLTGMALNAQVLMPGSFYVRENIPNKRPVPYVPEREADIMWSKRVWRTIDLREKFNHPLYYPVTPINDRRSLFDVVKKAIFDREIIAFDNAAVDDEFTTRMSIPQLNELFYGGDSIDQEDPFNPGTYKRVWQPASLESGSVKAWWVKEDWFWDKQRSVMDVRIVGLCPLQEKVAPPSSEGNQSLDVIGYKALFWVHFDQLRPVLAREACFNTRNDAQRLSFDDIFLKRMFSSYIHKESNVFDRGVLSYASGLEAMFESDRIRNDIFVTEHDYWHF